MNILVPSFQIPPIMQYSMLVALIVLSGIIIFTIGKMIKDLIFPNCPKCGNKTIELFMSEQRKGGEEMPYSYCPTCKKPVFLIEQERMREL